MIFKKAIGYRKAVDKLISIVGNEVQVDDGATTWTLWILQDACKDNDLDTDKTKYFIDDTGIYTNLRGYKQTPAVLRTV